MIAKEVDSPKEFVRELGGLHDARIDHVHFDTSARLLALEVRDLNSNLEGLPEYPGPRPCSWLFQNVKTLSWDIETRDGVRISDARIGGSDENYQLEIDLNLGGGDHSQGRCSIVVKFERLQVRDLHAESAGP